MKKKVLHLLSSNKYSGAENVACTIIENDKSYDMYYCSPNGEIKNELKKRKIKYIQLKHFTPFSVKKICKKYNIDIIHAHDFKASFLASFVNKKYKVISHLHNNYPFMKKWNIYSMIYSIIAKRFDKITGVSEAIVNEAIFGPKIENKYVEIYNCVDNNKIIELAKENYKNNYDLYFIGRLTEQKNPIRFIEIVSDIKKSKKDIKAIIIGNGELDNTINNKIKELQLIDNIDIIGFQSNPYKIMNNAKICIMPSIYEGFGLTAIEGMILGKPVLNTYVGGLKEIFSNNQEFNIDEKLIIDLLNNKSLYNEYSKKAKIIAKKYTNMDSYIKKINSLYEGD